MDEAAVAARTAARKLAPTLETSVKYFNINEKRIKVCSGLRVRGASPRRIFM